MILMDRLSEPSTLVAAGLKQGPWGPQNMKGPSSYQFGSLEEKN